MNTFMKAVLRSVLGKSFWAITDEIRLRLFPKKKPKKKIIKKPD